MQDDVLKSFPNRPLRRGEVDSLEDSDRIQTLFPVYGERPERRDLAYGLILVIGGRARAVAFDREGWVRIGNEEVRVVEDVREGDPGIGWDDESTIDELLESVTEFLDEGR